jgi:hypothetical protein
MSNKADGSYLAPLAGPAPQAEGPLPPDWYEKISRGLDELQRAVDGQRGLMVAMLREPERQRRQVTVWLMADEPSPSRSKH